MAGKAAFSPVVELKAVADLCDMACIRLFGSTSEHLLREGIKRHHQLGYRVVEILVGEDRDMILLVALRYSDFPGSSLRLP